MIGPLDSLTSVCDTCRLVRLDFAGDGANHGKSFDLAGHVRHDGVVKDIYLDCVPAELIPPHRDTLDTIDGEQHVLISLLDCEDVRCGWVLVLWIRHKPEFYAYRRGPSRPRGGVKVGGRGSNGIRHYFDPNPASRPIGAFRM
jgi:hypothetical protein